MAPREGWATVTPEEPPVVETPATPFPDRLRAFALTALQLALVLVIVYRFEIAAPNHFFPVLCVAAGGFLVHAWLPPRFRAAKASEQAEPNFPAPAQAGRAAGNQSVAALSARGCSP